MKTLEREGRKTKKKWSQRELSFSKKALFDVLVFIQVKFEVKYSPVAKLTPE